MEHSQPIGIFDSGLGGISVLRELRTLLPKEHFLYFGDSAYAPYGIKDKASITERCITICDDLVARGAKAIVVACNTATSACVGVLRERYDLPIVGMEPALKVACEQGDHQRIIVMATPLTLREEKFARLMERFQDAHTIYRQPCPRLVEIVEHDGNWCWRSCGSICIRMISPRSTASCWAVRTLCSIVLILPGCCRRTSRSSTAIMERPCI